MEPSTFIPRMPVHARRGFARSIRSAAISGGLWLALAIVASVGRAGPAVEFIGGGSVSGENVARAGVWTFDFHSPVQQANGDPCAFGVPGVFGEVLDAQGWTPGPESTVLPRVELMGPDWIDEIEFPGAVDSDAVGGGVLAFYDPNIEGYFPGHLSLMESPVIDLTALDITPGPLVLYWSSNTNPDPALTVLQWVVGIRTFDGIGWSPWIDLEIPLELGPHVYEAPLPPTGSVFQLHIGIHHPGEDVLIGKKDPPAKNAKVAKKPPAVIDEVWKHVPDIKQEGPTCAGASAADCLAYWASAGYPELMPAAADTTKKHEKLRDELTKKIYGDDKKVGGTDKNADKWPGGITDYLKEKGTTAETPQPNGRRPLESKRYEGAAACWDSLEKEFRACHDVMLYLHWCDENGEVIKKGNPPQPPGHGVTMGGLIESAGGKKSIKIANPWGDQTDEVNSTNRDKVYDTCEVEVTADCRIRLKHEELQKKHGGKYLCVAEINVIKPAEPAPFAPTTVTADLIGRPDSDGRLGEGGSPRAAGGNTTHGYSILNDGDHPLNYFGMMVDVPYENVQSPPGWTWQALPAPFPASEGCGQMLGPRGILWTTESNPTPVGGVVSGFQFEVDSSYPTMEAGVQWYTEETSYVGRFGYVTGPVPDPTVEVPDEPTPIADTRLAVFPNPAGDRVTVQYRLARAADVLLEVFDASGRKVRAVHVGNVDARVHHWAWDRSDGSGRAVASGVYFVRLRSGATDLQQRLVLLR